MVNGPDDVGDDRLRRVVHPPRLAHLRIIRAQKGFVEMHHRVFFPRAARKIAQHLRHIRVIEQPCQIVHRPSHAVIQIWSGDFVE